MSDSKVYGNSRFNVFQNESDGLYLHEFQPEYASMIVVQDGHLVLVKQFRASVGKETIELPGGRMEGAEDREANARRELAEETGLTCGTVHRLGTIHAHPSVMNRIIHLYFTNEVTGQQEQNLDDDEEIAVMRVPLEEAYAKILSGEWTDSELYSGLLLAKLRGLL